MFGRKKIEDLILDEPIRINQRPTTIRECRDNALAMAQFDYMTESERGLALTVMYLIDRLMIAEMAARGSARLGVARSG